MFSRNFSLLRASILTIAAVLLAAPAAFAQSTGGLKGKVRTVRGDGVPNAVITVRQKGEDIKTVTGDSDGNFTIDGLKPGRYNLVFEARGYSSGVLHNVEVRKNKVGSLGGRLILSPDQGSLVIVRGSVFFKEGVSVPGAEIEIYEVREGGSTSRLGKTTTSESGEFTFRRAEGSAKLRVKASYKGASGTKDIEVDSAAIYRLAITLDLSAAERR